MNTKEINRYGVSQVVDGVEVPVSRHRTRFAAEQAMQVMVTAGLEVVVTYSASGK